MIANRSEILAWLRKSSSLETADIALLEMLHPLVEQAVKDELANDIEYAQHTQYLPLGSQIQQDVTLADYDMVNGRVISAGRYSRSSRLQLRHTPVWTTDLAVYEDTGGYAGQGSGVFSASTLLTGGTDYYLDLDDESYSESGILIRASGTWSAEPRSIKVVYYGGWQRSHFDGGAASAIKLATILAVAKSFNESQANATSGGAGAIVSESIGKYSATYGQSATANTGLVITLPGESLDLLQKFRNYGEYLV